MQFSCAISMLGKDFSSITQLLKDWEKVIRKLSYNREKTRRLFILASAIYQLNLNVS